MILDVEEVISNKKNIEFQKLDYTVDEFSKKAINLAIENDIEEIPFCIILKNKQKFKFTFEDFNKEKINEILNI